jgi:hypothetical protein
MQGIFSADVGLIETSLRPGCRGGQASELLAPVCFRRIALQYERH